MLWGLGIGAAAFLGVTGILLLLILALVAYRNHTRSHTRDGREDPSTSLMVGLMLLIVSLFGLGWDSAPGIALSAAGLVFLVDALQKRERG